MFTFKFLCCTFDILLGLWGHRFQQICTHILYFIKKTDSVSCWFSHSAFFFSQNDMVIVTDWCRLYWKSAPTHVWFLMGLLNWKHCVMNMLNILKQHWDFTANRKTRISLKSVLSVILKYLYFEVQTTFPEKMEVFSKMQWKLQCVTKKIIYLTEVQKTRYSVFLLNNLV